MKLGQFFYEQNFEWILFSLVTLDVLFKRHIIYTALPNSLPGTVYMKQKCPNLWRCICERGWRILLLLRRWRFFLCPWHYLDKKCQFSTKNFNTSCEMFQTELPSTHCFTSCKVNTNDENFNVENWRISNLEVLPSAVYVVK